MNRRMTAATNLRNQYASDDVCGLTDLIRLKEHRYGPLGMYIVFGDFNVVRHKSKRIGSNFNLTSATAFNDFIIEGRFWDIPLGGHSFTRMTSNGEKLSKLDRFLISEDISNVIHNLQATVIDCHILDHRPIVLKQSKLDFGPTPFKLFNSWMLNPQFDALVTLSWNSAQHIDGSNSFIHFKEKIKRLKYDIKNWSRQSVNSRNQGQEELKQEIIRI
ncbi:RNA-directed DNA polymerase, eukaryota, reverse transcriptase zinc-binding domain protein [Tanacetum coccineum]